MKIKSKRAVSLVEVLIAIGIFSFVVAGLYAAFNVGGRTWIIYNNSVMLQQEARRSLFAMVSELREAKNILITKDPDGLKINFLHPGVGVVSYSWTDKGSDANKIIREHNAKKRILANNISSLSFDYPTNNSITIEITALIMPRAGQAMSFHLQEKVALRSRIYRPTL